MEYFTRNSDPDYYEKNCGSSNCGSYAFNIKEWYDADHDFSDEVGDVFDWIRDMAESYDNDEISDIYAEAVAETILNDFEGEIRELDEEDSIIDFDEELIAFRTFCIYDDDGWTNFDFHFKVFRDGGWKEKCGSSEVRFCTLEDWTNGINTYTSKVYYFAHKVFEKIPS